ncbi:cytochrome c oxidase subunit ccoO [Vibrio ishigakensis]|uniref:Cytochrome c oxidase subunit ccoO n=1 Tax=Vibrio ishigakensis TaxID=1481914 RepID=A0A0B8NXV3_9VIBR|nr:cytochrome c oxidase subunit ccoO [Vibrio ishigakensis]
MSKDFTQSLVILIITTIAVASFSIVVLLVPSLVRGDDIAEGSLAKPLTAIQVAGRDIYISEGCHVCHTQMVRPLEPEMKRNGRANKEADDIYEFQIFGAPNVQGPTLPI